MLNKPFYFYVVNVIRLIDDILCVSSDTCNALKCINSWTLIDNVTRGICTFEQIPE